MARLVVARRHLELVPVDVQHGRHEAGVVGELALDVLHGAAVEEVAAPAVLRVRPVVIDDRVAEREGTAEVKTSRQAPGGGLVEEDSPGSDAVLRPDDRVALQLEVALAVVVNIVVVDVGPLEVVVLRAGGPGGDEDQRDDQVELHVDLGPRWQLSARTQPPAAVTRLSPPLSGLQTSNWSRGEKARPAQSQPGEELQQISAINLHPAPCQLLFLLNLLCCPIVPELLELHNMLFKLNKKKLLTCNFYNSFP